MKHTLYLFVFMLILISCSKSNVKKIVWEEHFDHNKLDENFWNYELGDGCPNLCGWGNNERQVYIKDNVKIQDGNLVISATYDESGYLSGRITTKNKVQFQYGAIEVKAKIPVGKGLWPAIWMLGSDIDHNSWPTCGEIDIMEYVGKEPGAIYTSLHTSQSYGNTINSKKTIIKDIEEGYHIYKTIWTKEKIQFYIDDQNVYTFSPKIKNEKNWPFDKPFYLLINLAIGGNFGGPEVDDNIFPQEFKIDYIKITQ